MSFPRTIAYVLALVALALPARDAAHAQENAVRIEFAGDSSRSTVIGAFRRSGTVYVSLNDLAQIFQLATYESSESQKFEVKKLPLRMKVAGERLPAPCQGRLRRQFLFRAARVVPPPPAPGVPGQRLV